MLIGDPFRAVELVLHYLLERRSQQVKLLCFSKNNHRYIRIISNESIPYLQFEVQSALCSFGLTYDCPTAETSNRNMKLACLRLSQSFVLINTCGEEQSVALFAKGDIHYYSVNLKNGKLSKCSSEHTLSFIREHISPYQFESKFDEGTQEIILLDPPNQLVFATDDIQLQRGVGFTGVPIQLDCWEISMNERISRYFLEPPLIKVIFLGRTVDFIELKVIIVLCRHSWLINSGRLMHR